MNQTGITYSNGIKGYDATIPARESVTGNTMKASAQLGRCLEFAAMIEQHVLGTAESSGGTACPGKPTAYSLSGQIQCLSDDAATLAAKLEHLAFEIGCK